jgi:iduronate 2-sulfatase
MKTKISNCKSCCPFIFFLLLSNVFYAQEQSQKAYRYNVLFIAADDMNDRCSFFGNNEVITPNLQRLISRGMVFTHAYCQYPMCNASRTSLLSGWRPDKTQIFSNSVRPSSILGPNVVYLPMYFKQHGYRTERYGKIMHGLYEDDCKWDYAEPPESAEGGDLMFDADKLSKNITPSSTDPGGDWWIENVPDSTTNDGIEARHLLATMQRSLVQPFFYAVGFHSPHSPFKPSLYYWNMNGDPSVQELLPIDKNGETSDLKGNGSDPIIIPQTPSNDRDDVPSIAFPHSPIIKTNDQWKDAVHAYDAEVEEMDAQLGLILDELDKQNLWKNTIVIFLSDHGQHLGEHEGTWLKNTLFEESLHVPFIICVPGKKSGVCSRLIEWVDINPTLAELCGLPAPSGMQGSSFAPLLDNQDFQWKRAVFSQAKRSKSLMGRSIRTDQYRYTSWDREGEELYDHYTDPDEYTNLTNDPKYATILNQMRSILTGGWAKCLPPVYKLKTFYRDQDKDGYGNVSDSSRAYAKPKGFVANNTDCNDNNANVYPGATEICDGFDNNCDGRIDENNVCNAIAADSKNALSQLSKSVSLYPNPSRGNITISYNNNVAGKISLEVHDVTGRIVFSLTDMFVAKGIFVKKLDLSNLKTGTYYLSLYKNEKDIHVSFVIAR